MTPDQKRQIGIWAEERDAILKEIAVLEATKEKLSKDVSGLEDKNTELTKALIKKEEAIEIFDDIEEERGLLVKISLAQLIDTKTQLQTTIEGLDKEIAIKQSIRQDIINDIIFSLPDIQKNITLIKGLSESIKESVISHKESENTIDRMVGGLRDFMREHRIAPKMKDDRSTI